MLAAERPTNEPLLDVRSIGKSFGPTVALSGVDLSATRGEIHALIGENGAGKSTLLKILAGVETADRGDIRIADVAYAPSSPDEARRAGVAMVHQELSLCLDLTVAENILLGTEPTRFGVLRRDEIRRRVTAALAPILGASVDGSREIQPDTIVRSLSPASAQIVEIARALGREGLRLLILDEPTSSLGRDDVERLFALLRGLRNRGLTILYVSHFLEEVRSLADTYTVLRDGRSVGHGVMAEAPLSTIIAQMVGRDIQDFFPRSVRSPGDVVLSLDELGGDPLPRRASLGLRRGEVLGIAGLLGAGRTELMRAIFGLDPIRRGTIRFKAFSGPASPAARLAQGMGFASEDRKGEGLALPLSIADNLTLSRMTGLGPLGLILGKNQRTVADRWIADLSIRCRDADQRVSELSGGNQQKIAIGRLLHHEVDVLLLDEPTRGVDVGSKAQIYELIDRQAMAGCSVLMVSSYLPELFGVCDRLAVMSRGVLGPAVPVGELDAHTVLEEATRG